jgi:hypothetical protein
VYRKNSSFFQKAAGPDADLTLRPTTLQSKITPKVNDYGKKCTTRVEILLALLPNWIDYIEEQGALYLLMW